MAVVASAEFREFSPDRPISADTVSAVFSGDCLDVYCLIYIKARARWEKKLYELVLI